MVSCWNRNDAASPLHHSAAGRIAQLVIVPVQQVRFREVVGVLVVTAAVAVWQHRTKLMAAKPRVICLGVATLDQIFVSTLFPRAPTSRSAR